MIEINEVIYLLQSLNSENLICKNLELRPQNLAMFIAALSNSTEQYGYILLGVNKDKNGYSINGISKAFNLALPIRRALDLLSEQPIIESGSLDVEGKNIYAIKVMKKTSEIFFNSLPINLSLMELFIRNLYLACIKLQARKLYVNASEDERNDFITDLLETNGYHIKDQTRRGSSTSGKSSGEIDIFVENDKMPFTIVEALNLNSLNTTYLDLHLDKIYSYDTVGNAFNVCLSYVKVKDFESFWNRYCDYVKTREYPVMFVSSDTNADRDYPYSDIRFMTTTHNRSGKSTILYHMCIKIQE